MWKPQLCLILVLLAAPAAWCVDAIALSDTSGQALGILPVVAQGDERLVPLASLVRAANWTLDQEASVHRVTSPSGCAELQAGNPFAKLPNGFVQLRMAPSEWDGSLWVPVVNLRDLFGSEVEVDLRRGGMRVHVLPVPEPVVEAEPVSPDTTVQQWTLNTVIVDPGHGGKDPGCVGPQGLEEKTVTLDIARRLASLLRSRGLQVKLTRNSDEFVPLHTRTSYANQCRGDLFLSIHCNSWRDPQVRGVQTYFLKPARSERAVDAALRENSVVKLEDGSVPYQDLTEENYILLTMAISQYIRDSEQWAGQVLHEAAQATETESRGVDQAGFYVLMGATMPAVLVECGYLSNPDDAAFLTSDSGRQEMAEALCNSIMKVKQTLEANASR